jgi:cytochrome c biogenesis protein CcmG, thiol:disulfide interchange protein DsbE
MRNFVSLLAMLLLGIPSHAANLVGQLAPAFSVTEVDGTQIGLGKFRGKVVYLDFWASWCGPCRKSFPWMNAMQSKYAAQGLQIIAVNVDEKRDDAMAFLKAREAGFVVGLDPLGAIPASYGVKGMPSSFLIGRDGKVIDEHVGFNETDSAMLEKNIHSALEAKP